MASLVVAYTVFALFLACIGLLAQPAIASALIQVPDLLAQVLFTPLLAVWSIWVGIAISARSSDIQRRGDVLPGIDADRAGRVLFDAYLGVLYRWVGRDQTQAGIEEDLLAVLDVLLNGVIGAAHLGTR